MPYHYTDASRETDPHALPDVEIFDQPTLHQPCGEPGTPQPIVGRAYFWAFLDGGLDAWSSDPSGPYPTEADALTAAREAAGFCAHGVADDAVCEECPAPELWVIERATDERDRGTYLAFTWGSVNGNACAAWGREDAACSQAQRMADAGLLVGGWRIVRLPDAEARRWGRSDADASQ